MEIRKLRQFFQTAFIRLNRLGTNEDLLIVLEIASNQQPNNHLTLKQLLLSGIAPESTLKRRLARLVKQGIVIKSVADGDRRLQRYEVPAQTLEMLRNLARELRGFDWH